MVVYELLHTYFLYENTPCYSKKRLGYYSDMEKLRKEILFYSKLPGFCDAPDGFVIKQREVSGAIPDICFYEACIYAHTENFEDYEYELELGLFYDEKSAHNAIASFCANNALFLNNHLLEIEQLVQKYTINERCGWVEGFTVEQIP